ncbi:MAG: MarR family winged helix-turn-helix transcriptional regulator [Fidelibacterota bacterium]
MEFGELVKLFLLDLQYLFRDRVVTSGMTLTQILLLSSIPDEGIDMTALTRRMGVDNSTLTRLVDVLIRRGWIKKNKNPEDGRSIIVSFTPDGDEIQRQIEEKIDQFGESLYREIPFESRDEVKEVLSSFHWMITKSKLKQ